MKQDGTEYPSETLYALIMNLQGHLHSMGKKVKFLEEKKFQGVWNTLDNQMKSLSKKGVVQPKNQVQVIILDKENKLWDLGLLGDDTPKKLVNTLIYLLGIHLALRGGDEHKSLKVGYYSQIKVKYDEDQQSKYLEYRPTSRKNNQGGLKDLCWQDKIVTAYENKQNPQHCVVHIFEKYMGRQPFDLPCCSLDLYLHPLTKIPRSPNAKWYSCQPMGIHAIQSILSALCEKAGIKGKHTNYALKATCATRMYSKGFDKQLVCEQLGNSSEAVCAYKRTNSEQKMQISEALYGNKKVKSLQKSNPPVLAPKENTWDFCQLVMPIWSNLQVNMLKSIIIILDLTKKTSPQSMFIPS